MYLYVPSPSRLAVVADAPLLAKKFRQEVPKILQIQKQRWLLLFLAILSQFSKNLIICHKLRVFYKTRITGISHIGILVCRRYND